MHYAFRCKYAEHVLPKDAPAYLCGNRIGSVQDALRHDDAQLAVDLLQLLRQLRNGLHVVGLHHGVGGVQLLDVGIVRVQVHGQRHGRRVLSVRDVALFVVHTTLWMGWGVGSG